MITAAQYYWGMEGCRSRQGEWIDKNHGSDLNDTSVSELKGILDKLCENGVIIECYYRANNAKNA